MLAEFVTATNVRALSEGGRSAGSRDVRRDLVPVLEARCGRCGSSLLIHGDCLRCTPLAHRAMPAARIRLGQHM